MSAPEKIIAICIATYNRPVMLTNCLRSICNIIVPESYKAIVIIVDNDKNGSAQNCYEEELKNLPFDAHYQIEPDRGICSARNNLLETALSHDADYIAFIDDDELAHKDWLTNLIKALETYQVEIIAGPVIPIKETIAPETFGSVSKYRTGTIPRNIPAGNVLFNVKLVKELSLRFDRYFDFIGGEDFDFFDRAKQKNMRPVWISEAVIFETIPHERETNKYKIYRHFTGGINAVLRYRRNHFLINAWGRYLPKALGKFIGALTSLLMAIFTERKKNLEKSIIKLANGIGYLCGLSNIIIERYRY